MQLGGKFHLTYCSNIHAGESWAEVSHNISKYVPLVKRTLSPDRPFGIGLRLSAAAAKSLQQSENLSAFKEFLRRENLYVFTINGFPYGVFHGTPVKEQVYLPDWKDEARLIYTDRLAYVLAELLPEDGSIEGTISTAPGAFKAEVHGDADVRRMASLMLQHVVTLHGIRERTGKTISLALEPEPCCHMETVDETVAFFEDYLFSPSALRELSNLLGVSEAESLVIVRRHLGVCFDACHMAVEYEDLVPAFEKFKRAGIRIGKIQISSALKARFVPGDGRVERLLMPFAESTYLHQVVERSSSGSLTRYCDLPEALAECSRPPAACGGSPPQRGRIEKEWRIHFHIPIFLSQIGEFETTQDYLVLLLEYLRKDPVCAHLEVETYTWDVLPPEYRNVDIGTAITRELKWVIDRMPA